MTVMHRIYGVLAVIGLAAPAAAQDSQAITDAVQQALREVRVEVLAAAQAGRGAAARAAAQAEREAERRRRQEARQGPEIAEQFSKTARLGRNGTFSLENVAGEITITGGGGNDVRVEATKRVRHPNEAQARAIMQALTINVAERDGSVDVRTEYPGRRNGSGSVDYMVTVPRDASVSLRSVSGEVKVTNVNGELRIESVSGGIVTTGARRIRTLKTYSGDVQISDSESDDLIAGTVSGNLVIRNVKARIISLSSVSGDLRLTDLDADHVEMHSVSGNLEYVGRLSRSGRYELRTYSGNVRITPVGTQSFSLEATTFSGDVRSDYPLTLQGQIGNDFARRRNRSVRATFGSGGAMLTLQSFSGNVVIVKQ
ncbi:MAG TPA: DUF4097 family beta strand repeat-containing protein [Vicinamibacterales bacterium]|nr:DUF4097 family beta strand repeat-containing protein [Vicinamibacterales bacterium]